MRLKTYFLCRLFLWVLIFSALASGGGLLRAQVAKLRGRVVEKLGQVPVPFATVQLQDTNKGTVTDDAGQFLLEGLQPGNYNLVVSCVGYEKKVLYDVDITRGRVKNLSIALVAMRTELEEVAVVAENTFVQTDESPVSSQSVGVNEIRRMPGGNRDVSGVIRSLPGASSTPSFRNDIIIRGGAPSENTFYIEDIPLPVLNHFQTQGSSGGPQGILNVDMLSKVQFYSGAFPVNRAEALSSVFDFYYKKPSDKWGATLIQGASDAGAFIEGPVTKDAGLILSVRRSYLQVLLPIIGLPFVPAYTDLQGVYKHRINQKHKLTLLGVSSFDSFSLNESVADNQEGLEKEASLLALENIPINGQDHYTAGGKHEYFYGKGTLTTVLSRNHLWNRAYKYRNNDESSEDNKILDYSSQERENHFRIENFQLVQDFRLTYGLNYDYGEHLTSVFFKTWADGQPLDINDDSYMNINKLGLFGNVAKDLLRQRLTLSLGFRLDDNDYTSENFLLDIYQQFSPRVAASYKLTRRVSLNATTGIYHQLPPYTTLGFKNEQGRYVNRDNGVRYVRSYHGVGGFAVDAWTSGRFSVEGFYKYYDRYPLSVETGVSVGNFGADFGVFGNEEVTSTAVGRSYGAEFLFQQKFYKGYYGPDGLYTLLGGVRKSDHAAI